MKPLKNNNWYGFYNSWWSVYTHYGGDLPWLVILTKGGINISVKITDIDIQGTETKEIIITTTNGKNKIIISPQNQWQIKYGKTAKGRQIFTKLIGDNHEASPIFDST